MVKLKENYRKEGISSKNWILHCTSPN